MKTLTIVAVFSAALMATAPADARVCQNSHGKVFHCHQLVKPRINFHKHHPIKILRCRGHMGKLNKC